VAFAALGSSFAFITSQLANIGSIWKAIGCLLIVVVGLALAVLVPVLILGVIRLRRRDLAAILEASGWAINARLRIKRGLGTLFTFEPDFPENAVSQRANLVRRLARKVGKRPSGLTWFLRILSAVVLGAALGYAISWWFGLVFGRGWS
jgi:hypothetical protein